MALIAIAISQPPDIDVQLHSGSGPSITADELTLSASYLQPVHFVQRQAQGWNESRRSN